MLLQLCRTASALCLLASPAICAQSEDLTATHDQSRAVLPTEPDWLSMPDDVIRPVGENSFLQSSGPEVRLIASPADTADGILMVRAASVLGTIEVPEPADIIDVMPAIVVPLPALQSVAEDVAPPPPPATDAPGSQLPTERKITADGAAAAGSSTNENKRQRDAGSAGGNTVCRPLTGPTLIRPSSLCDRGCRNWTVDVGAIFMFRDTPSSSTLIVDPAQPARRLNASDFDFGLQAGLETSLTLHNAVGEWDLTARHFGIDDWSDSEYLTINTNPIQINNTPPTFLSGPRGIASHYSSSLQSFEWNLSRPVAQGPAGGPIRLVAGVRHLQVREKLNTRFTSLLTPPISTEDYRIRTRNHLYGLQLGLDASLSGDCRHCVEGYARAGLYANDARNRSALMNYVSPPATFAERDRDTDLAFVGELGINANYRLRDNVSIFAGYRVLWIDGVALASDQVASTNFAPGTSMNNSGDVLYHGARFGLEIWF